MKKKKTSIAAILLLAAVVLASWLLADTQDEVPGTLSEPNVSLSEETVPSEEAAADEREIPNEAAVRISGDTASQDAFGTYAENYAAVELDGISYEGYRIAGDEENGGVFRLTTPEQTLSCTLLEGSFGNVTPIDGMQKITIAYKSDEPLILSYGNDRNSLSGTAILPMQEEYEQQETILTESASFFRLSASGGVAHVSGLDLYCGGDSSDETTEHWVEGIRYVPETDYDPCEGRTLEMPVVQQESDGSYTVTGWKSYTYHSFAYCKKQIQSKGESPETYALTDPVDVANYFVLFNRIPANYGAKDGDEELWAAVDAQTDVPSGEEVLAVFGSDLARLVRPFSRTDGYVTAIDFSDYEHTGRPLYYEFDFDVDGTYAFSGRGVGRVVGWAEGFACYGDGINAATVTTDHYYTFGEYTNCGFFNPNFDGTSRCKTGLTFAQSAELAITGTSASKAA